MTKRRMPYGPALPALVLVLALQGGCAAGRKGSTFEKLPEASVQSSSVMEDKGDITLAVEELKIALTIDPQNKKAREELKRLTEKRDREAEQHFRAGMALREQDPAGAGKEFLAALRIRSDYPEAVTELKNLQLELSEATIESRAERKSAAAARAKTLQSEDEESSYLDTAVSYYEDGDYAAAIRELQKARSRHPNDQELLKYLNLSWYHSGIIWMKKKEYRKALDAFAKVKKGFEHLEENVRQCRQAQKRGAEDLYKSGLKYFREQKLPEAIGKWQAVLELDPDHVKAREYIEKARKLQEALRRQR